MFKKVVVYTFVLAGGYLLLSHATEGGQLLQAADTGYVDGVKVLQGR